MLAVTHLAESCITLQVVKGTDVGTGETGVRIRIPPPGFGYVIAVTLRSDFTSPES